MFNIGTPELILILFLVFLLFGPKALPDIARQLGRLVREVRKVSDEMRRAFLSEIDEAKEPLRDVAGEMEGIKHALEQESAGIERGLTSLGKSISYLTEEDRVYSVEPIVDSESAQAKGETADDSVEPITNKDPGSVSDSSFSGLEEGQVNPNSEQDKESNG